MKLGPVRTLASLVVLVSLGACDARESAVPPPATGESDAAEPVVEGSGPPSWKEAANGSYLGPMGMAFQMKNGEWTGEPYVEGGAAAPRAGLASDFLLQGDLDGDGADDSVVLVWTSTGGSGTFDYLAVVARRSNGTVAERASVELGDRVHIRDARIANGRVVLDTVQAGPGDAMCCPGQLMRRSFELEGDTMTEVSTEDRGRLSLADLDGDWELVEFDRQPLPDNVRVTARFENGRLSGTAACNQYSGSVEASGAPGDIRLAGPLAVTRKMCPPPLMEWERYYLEALAGLSKFSFTAGKLVLTHSDESGVGSLLFDSSKPASEGVDEG